MQNPEGLGSKVKQKIIVSAHMLVNHNTFLLAFFFELNFLLYLYFSHQDLYYYLLALYLALILNSTTPFLSRRESVSRKWQKALFFNLE